ncbi:dihydropteroate synthase [Thermophagus sp. OGC60D27]|uniref:dihydropteroate synthase n=1 Tax=Thermophagus sp. OGC60D27 TaxID=3458415 RepID=UPI0040378391
MEDFKVENRFLHKAQTINCRGRLVDLTQPLVMGIVNITPDSFYKGSRVSAPEKALQRVEEILSQGGSIVDIGAYSSRPGASDISAEEEGLRLWPVLEAVRKKWPDLLISVDTFRSSIARQAVEHFEIDIINDISGGELDEAMFETVAQLKVPYILMHMKGTPAHMQEQPYYEDVTREVILYLSEKLNRLRELGVSDVVIDPGFGFGKTIEHNYQLLKDLEQFCMLECPILVGLSRKSMIFKYLNGSPEDALNGTSVLNTLALTKGANVLRVHDVKEAVECVKLVSKMTDQDFRH